MLKPSINEVLDKIDNRYYLVGTVKFMFQLKIEIIISQ